MSDRKEEYKYQEKALTLVTEDPSNGRFIINEETIEFIKSVPEPLAIVSVAGLYRTGKSYLLNRMLLNTKSGFGVASTVNPCTKGLWIWGKPIEGTSPDGEPVNILVIDTEGLGALDRDSNYDSRIFSLAVLVASCFLYNSVGNIDEQALELLSFVVNLTKQIQIRANPNEDVDFEDYAQHFPSFLWILRDFSLQLLGQDGETLSSRDYLERALKPQKGLSEGIEQKNRIRKHIMELFKERDCFTFVRPVTKETDLHNLSSLEMNQLRPEFLDQMSKFRKKVLEGVKPKRLNGTLINGIILGELIHSYVEAINTGAVPNIENTWTRICRDECTKRVEESIKLYDQYLVSDLYNRIPLPELEIKALYRKYKEEVIKYYKKRAIGDVSKDYEKDLMTQIKFKASQLVRANGEESRKLCETLLSKEFYSIDKKVRNSEYQQFSNFVSDINLFYAYFMEKGPEIPNKEVALLDFLLECVKKAALAFIRNSESEVQTQRGIANELKQRQDNYVSEVKNEFMREKSLLSSQLSQLQTEKAELEIRESNFKETIQSLKNEFSNREKSLKVELNREKANNKALSEEYQGKLSEYQNTVRELEQKLFLSKSEHEKERALLEQKANLLERSLEEHMSKEKDQRNQFNSYKTDFNNQIKEITVQYETNLKLLHKKVSTLSEKLIEQEDLLKQKELQLEDYQSNSMQDAFNKDEVVHSYLEKIKGLEISLIGNTKEHDDELNNMRLHYEENIRTMKRQVEEAESAAREKEDRIKSTKLKSDKEKAVLQQKIDFLEVQIAELRGQLDKSRRDHDKILETFEKSGNEGTKPDQREINELKQAHESELKRFHDDFELIQKKLAAKNEELQNKMNDMQLKHQLRETEYATQFKKLREELETLHNSKDDLTSQNRTLEVQKKKILDEVEHRYHEKIRSLEQQLEEKTSSHEEELAQLQRKSEEALSQVRAIFEVEKQRYEKRVFDEREKNSNVYSQEVDELAQKLEEERNAHDEEMDTINEQLREKEAQICHQIQQFEHELELKQQTIDNLNKYLKETKENLNNIQSSHNQIIEQQLDTFNRERKTFLDKIEDLTLNNTKLEKEIYLLTQKIQNFEDNTFQKEETIITLKKEFAEEKANLKRKFESEKSEYLKNSDNFLTSKVEAAKEIALLTQQNEFLQRRYEDLKKQHEELTIKFEESTKTQKESYTKELNNLIDKFSGERVALEEKYESKRKSAKEMEMAFQKKLTQLEKDKVILVAQVATLEAKKTEYEKKIANETDTYSGQINELRENFLLEKRAQSIELEKYKDRISQAEHELAELQSNNDRDRALWEGKYSFLEQQRDQAKSDLIDAQKKFEFALQQLQRARSADKENNETNQQSLIISIEKRYNSKMQELQEAYNNQIRELLEKKEKLEKEVKHLNERILLEDFGKKGNSQLLEKKVSDLTENEKRLQKEIDDLKNERDTRMIDFQKRFDKESDTWRAKFRECEHKVKEAETKRSLTLFEYEKEKAKWNVERDYLVNQNAELQNSIKKMEKKKEQLLVENEKMKSSRKPSILNSSINSNAYKGGLSRREASHSPMGKRYGRVMMEIDDNIQYTMKTFEAFKHNHMFDLKSNSTATNLDDDHEKCDTEGDSISKYSLMK